MSTSLPLSAAQLGIFHAQRLEPASRSYVVGEVLEISGIREVDVEALRHAVRTTVGEAETLRLRVVETADGPRQVVSDEPVPLPAVVDLRGDRDPVAVAHALVDAERARVSEQCRGMLERPLTSHTLLQLSDTEVWCVQLYHHLVVDGYSAAMISRRVAAHYTSLVRGTPPPRPVFGALADVVAADAEYRASEQLVRDRDFWRETLTPLPDLTGRPPALDGPAERTFSARAVLDPDALARVRAVAEVAGTTWADVLIGCYAAFLHRLLGTSDVVLALPVVARVGVALRTPAMAVNVLPLRLTVRPGDDAVHLSRRVAAALRDLRAHQRYRGEDLPRDLGAEAAALVHGVGINLKAFDAELDFAGSTGVLRNVAGGPPEDLGLTVTPLPGDRLQLGFEVDVRSCAEATVHARAAALERTIRALTAPATPAVASVDLLAAGESERVLAARAEPAVGPVPADAPTPVAEVLVQLAARAPDATALVCGATRVSTSELARAVHRLARGLRARGVGPEDVVALALPRSADLVVALLAVLDAGAAFLPLDLEHPAPRRQALVDDAGAVLVLDVELLAALRAESAGESEEPLAEGELAGPRDPDHLAYVIHTSGSTGRPKGVLGRAGALAALLHHHGWTLYADIARQAGGRRLRTANTASFAFDAALDQLLWLLCGHELHLYGRSCSATPWRSSRRSRGTASTSSTRPRRWRRRCSTRAC